ncbi:spore germination protein [Paenibacillus sp. P96]|uniref:Spore germination protein n=1 Tax=Paenibacillus zeirhizosphaerae TaxID=2987519 RepID=A0ABT9FTZ0_9BACL|nr:spore germination protein [Paenibacillus sp. P96]MDP4098211.1 spore germination protein [Paenibacillus sp. P96]
MTQNDQVRNANEDQNHHHSNILSPSLEETLSVLKQKLGKNSDFIIRQLHAPLSSSPGIAVSYIDGLIDQQLLIRLMEALSLQLSEGISHINLEARLGSQLPIGNLKSLYTEEDMINSLLEGEAIIIVDDSTRAFAAAISGGAKRAVEEPSSQTVIRGPKEGFTEDIAVNIAMLRRKIKSPDLCIESLKIGKYTQTRVAVSYIQGIADPEIVQEIMRRLNSIETDSILESGYIEEFIQDQGQSFFPTIYNTERPDSVAGGLLEGIVAILVDGTPFVLLAPATFFRFFTSSEDYYERFDLSSFLRIIRLGSFMTTLLLPALYIATTTFQQEMLPTTLFISLAAQRESTPLPALLEALVMEVTFEIIREAGIRMPRAVGPAISIVGALVLGQAAVQAGLVSAAMVIVVSFTAISNFVIPSTTMAGAVRLLRFGLMILAGSFGMYGILIGFVPILFRIVTIQSLGVPYFMTLVPLNKTNWKDLIIRAPWWKMKTRPKLIGDKNKHRQSVQQKPFAQQAMKQERDPLE